MKTLYNEQDQASSENNQWQRDEVASNVIDYENAKEKISQREYAKTNSIPRTTLQHWLYRKESLYALRAEIEFFESPVGLAFLHRMVVAAHMEFGENSPASLHNISRFFKLCNLDPFIGTSYSTQCRFGKSMDNGIIQFGELEKKRLSENMPKKKITLCEDETFHPETCMVAIEPRSNFIILEKYVEDRKSKTWNKVVDEAIEGMNVEVNQVTSDEARGITNHTTKGLQAHHSPDCFHVSQEISKGTSGALASTVKKAEKELDNATKETEKQICLKDQYDNQPKRPRGRRPHFEKRIESANAHQKEKSSELETAKDNQKIVHNNRREIGRCYHPYDPESGEKQDAQVISGLLESCFENINNAITGLSDRCKKRVDKAHRVVKDMVANVAFFFLMIEVYMDNLGISSRDRELLHDYLIPGFYLKEVARKEKDKVRKIAIYSKSQELLSIVSNNDSPYSDYSIEKIEMLEKAAEDCAYIFQRSSSCVEGRNAQLSLHHHGIHKLSDRHLKALTIVHNFYIRNRDGTTPAERFFEAKHNDLFEWLLDNLDYPVRPRKRLAKAA